MPQQLDTDDIELNHRERATLRAVAGGHAEISCSCEPDLFIDGLPCCDQATARRLASRGLVAPAYRGAPGKRVPALLTELGNTVVAKNTVLDSRSVFQPSAGLAG